MSKDNEETYDEIKGLDPSFFELTRENYLKINDNKRKK